MSSSTTPDRGLGPAGPAITLIVSLALAAAIGMVIAPSAGSAEAATTEGHRPRLVSVQFDLSTGDAPSIGPLSPAGVEQPAVYERVRIEHASESRSLRPWDGPFELVVQSADGAVAAEVDGLRTGPGGDGLPAALSQAVSSAAVQRLVRIDGGAGGSPAVIDLRLPHAMSSSDYVLVQEVGGDATIEIEGLDGAGNPVGPATVVAAPYTWNTGHPSLDGPSHWATVIPAPGADGGVPVEGLRIRSSRAEVKIVVLGPDGAQVPVAGSEAATAPSPPVPVAVEAGPAATPAPSSSPSPVDDVDTAPPATVAPAALPTDAGAEPAVIAAPAPAIDLAVGVMPAVAVGGSGCDEAVAQRLGPRPGQGTSTFCFAVTNTGSVPVDQVSVTDVRAGLADAVLPRASGPEVLDPGERAVYYHHATPVGGTGEQLIRAEATATGSSSGDRASAVVGAGADPTEAVAAAPTVLAMTGVVTEPWVLVALATGAIFFGYTTVAAYRRPAHRPEIGQPRGHDLLDELGFDEL